MSRAFASSVRSGTGDADVTDKDRMITVRMVTVIDRLLVMLLTAVYLCVNDGSPYKLELLTH